MTDWRGLKWWQPSFRIGVGSRFFLSILFYSSMHSPNKNPEMSTHFSFSRASQRWLTSTQNTEFMKPRTALEPEAENRSSELEGREAKTFLKLLYEVSNQCPSFQMLNLPLSKYVIAHQSIKQKYAAFQKRWLGPVLHAIFCCSLPTSGSPSKPQSFLECTDLDSS
jgi:hypothetical protein